MCCFKDHIIGLKDLTRKISTILCLSNFIVNFIFVTRVGAWSVSLEEGQVTYKEQRDMTRRDLMHDRPDLNDATNKKTLAHQHIDQKLATPEEIRVMLILDEDKDET